MNLTSFLAYLLKKGMKIWIDNGRFCYWAPKGIVDHKLRNMIVERKKEIVNRLDEQKIYTLASYAQQRLWFLDQMTPNNANYNIPLIVKLGGQIDKEALSLTFNSIINRHETLRTIFTALDGEPFQVILPAVTIDIELIDMSESTRNKLEETIVKEAKKTFDLLNGPLIRATLIKKNSEENVLVLTVHHIIFDGWSMGILVREVEELYNAYTEKRQSLLPQLSMSYCDFTIWQHRFAEGELFQQQLSYWMKNLKDAPKSLDLPIDFIRPAIPSFSGNRIVFELPKTTMDTLKELCVTEGATLFMVLLTAFKILIFRYTMQEDIMIGSPIANRNKASIEGLIGFFVNTLVLRTDLSKEPSFRQLLHRIREVTLKAYAHQDLPFEMIVEKLKLDRDLSKNPLIQTMFVLQNAPSSTLKLNDLDVEALEMNSGNIRFDMEFHLWEYPDGIKGVIGYSSDLFKEETIKRMIEGYIKILDSVVHDPNQKIQDIPMLSTRDEQLLLNDWNNTRTNPLINDNVSTVFERQVEVFGDNVAVVFEDQWLSYKELNKKANQLANYLRNIGIGPDVLVGVYMERSLEMVISLLAIIKAGGAYLPMDLSSPKERIKYILQDTEVPVILTHKGLDQQLPPFEGRTIPIDAKWQSIAREMDKNLPDCTTGHNLIYVMYTSGTTGRPKGVCVTHSGVIRLVKDTNYVKLSATDVFLQFAAISFDASTFEIWGSLLNGAKLVMFPNDTASLEELGLCIQKHRVTVLWLTATLFNLMVDERIEDLKGIGQILAGGEVLSINHVRKAKKELKECQIINGYGPTENTTFTCCHSINEESLSKNSIPIGKPISHTQVYVLDKYLNLVPIGASGELYVGGEGLARGYHERPMLTAERFIPNPFSHKPGERLYRTGDYVRWLTNGELEFLGRFDNQVKIRGFRIELEEIEAILQQHAYIKSTIVLMKENQLNEKQLVAYVIGASDYKIVTSELRQFLYEKLPDYMVPTSFVIMDKFPINNNGKVDKQALRNFNYNHQEQVSMYVAPCNDIEERIAQVWKEALQMVKVGVNDNFFDLGGHSLLVAKVHSKLQHIVEEKVSIIDLFRYPTIRELAKYLTNKQNRMSSVESGHMRAENRVKSMREQMNRTRYRRNR